MATLGIGGNYGYDLPSLSGQQLAPQYAKPLGQMVEDIGTMLNLKEGNISESIAGGPTRRTLSVYAADNPTVPGPGGAFPQPNPNLKTGGSPQPQPQPQPQVSGGNYMDYYTGWDANQAQQDFQNVFGGDINKLMAARGVGSSGSQPDHYAQIRSGIESGYNDYIGQLNRMLDQDLPAQQGIQNEIINNQYTSGENSLTNQQNIGLSDLGTERTQATQNQSKNLKDISENLRNMFMSGNVFLGSRGAGDSSAANQYSYALTKVGNKARGDVMSQTAGIQAEIAKRETNLKQTVQTELQNLGRERDNKILEVSNWIREQQNAIRERIGQVGLSKSSDLTNLNTKILDAALAKLQQADEDVRNKKNLLTEWAANNATNINQLKSNLAAVSSYNPQLPQAQQFSGTPTISGGNIRTPINWSSNTQKEEEKPGIFDQLPQNTWLKG